MLEGHNQVFKLPHQDTVQIVGSVADAVVCQTVLREVVCAYLFFTAAGADEIAAARRVFSASSRFLASKSLARRIFMPFSRFFIWLRSSSHRT